MMTLDLLDEMIARLFGAWCWIRHRGHHHAVWLYPYQDFVRYECTQCGAVLLGHKDLAYLREKP
jgi:hypothetical protein